MNIGNNSKTLFIDWIWLHTYWLFINVAGVKRSERPEVKYSFSRFTNDHSTPILIDIGDETGKHSDIDVEMVDVDQEYVQDDVVKEQGMQANSVKKEDSVKQESQPNLGMISRI